MSEKERKGEAPDPDPPPASEGREDVADAAPASEKSETKPEKKEPEAPRPRTLTVWHHLAALRRETPITVGLMLGALCLLIAFGVWSWLTAGPVEQRIVSPNAIPSPSEAWAELVPLYQRGLIEAIFATLQRVVYGFGLAIFVGVTVGIAAASFRPLQAFLRPLVLFGRSIPLAALIPLTLVLFGISDKQKIMFIFIATVPFIFSDTVAAILTIPERYVDTARTLGASRFQIIRKVLVPLAVPDMVTGIRFLFGLAFGYIMLAESINAKAGLGYLIYLSQTRGGKPEHVFLLLIIIALLAYVIDRMLLFFQRGLFPYRQDL